MVDFSGSCGGVCDDMSPLYTECTTVALASLRQQKRCCTRHNTETAKGLSRMHPGPNTQMQPLCAVAERQEGRLGSSVTFCSVWKNSSTEEEPWQREYVQAEEDLSMEGLRELRKQIDGNAPVSQTMGTLMNDVIVRGQELLTTEVSRW